MSLGGPRVRPPLGSFPRPCGDEPGTCPFALRHLVVFPAHAGMSPPTVTRSSTPDSFPRPCGDEPPYAPAGAMWSGVFPAHAGMSPLSACDPIAPNGFPRPRGDELGSTTPPKWSNAFSPPMRGCAQIAVDCPRCRVVFPAHAGMSRRAWNRTCSASRFPRPCGDEPTPDCRARTTPWFSPPARG